jgi:hypothetical protein
VTFFPDERVKWKDHETCQFVIDHDRLRLNVCFDEYRTGFDSEGPAWHRE